MVTQFNKLSNEDQKLLFRAPVLVSVLASCSLNEVNKSQKADAIKLSHLKTFTSNYLLREYYAEVEKHFKEEFEATAKEFFPFDEEKRNALKREIEKVNMIISRLEKKYGEVLHTSLEGYAAHVKRAKHSVFQDFIFPLPIPGLSA